MNHSHRARHIRYVTAVLPLLAIAGLILPQALGCHPYMQTAYGREGYGVSSDMPGNYPLFYRQISLYFAG